MWQDIFNKHAIQDAEAILVISDLNDAFKFFTPRDKIRETKNLFKFLKSLANKKRPIIFPAFTHSFGKTGVFDVLKTRPEQMGTLPLMAFKDQFFYRTLSPITSYFIWPHCGDFIFNKFTTTFGETSLFGWLNKRKCRIICIGKIPDHKLGWIGVHHSEEINKVPYRFFKIFFGTIIAANKEEHSVTQYHYARRREMKIKNDFSLLNRALSENGLRVNFNQNGIDISSVWCSDLMLVSDSLIRSDPFAHTKYEFNSV